MNRRTFRLAATFAAVLPAGTLPAADATPPVAPKVPHMQTLHGETLKDDYYWLREKDNPKVRAFLEAENAYTEAFMKPTEPLQKDALRRDARPHQGDRPLRAVPGGRLVLLLADREGKAVPDLLPQEGLARGPGGGLPRRQRARRGRALHVRRGARGQRRREAARLHDRHHGLPRLHPARQGPVDRQAPSGDRRARDDRRLGGRQQHPLLHDDGSGEAAVPALSPRARHGHRRRTRSSTRRRTRSSASSPDAPGAAP